MYCKEQSVGQELSNLIGKLTRHNAQDTSVETVKQATCSRHLSLLHAMLEGKGLRDLGYQQVDR